MAAVISKDLTEVFFIVVLSFEILSIAVTHPKGCSALHGHVAYPACLRSIGVAVPGKVTQGDKEC
jgi:hypothetical protein